MTVTIGRRELLAALGGVAPAWPRTARAQQPAMPVVGYLNLGGSPESDSSRLTGLRRGLNQTGYVEGRNLLIEYRSPLPNDVMPRQSANLAGLLDMVRSIAWQTPNMTNCLDIAAKCR